MDIIYLLALHHFADTSLQPSWLIKNKRHHPFAIFEHVMVYALIMTAGFAYFGVTGAWVFFWFAVGHYIIDFIKYTVIPDDPDDAPYWLIYPDQFLHYAQIWMVHFIFLGDGPSN